MRLEWLGSHMRPMATKLEFLSIDHMGFNSKKHARLKP